MQDMVGTKKVIGGEPILWKIYFEKKLNAKALHKEGHDEKLRY